MIENIDSLKERLKRAYEKKDKAEEEIKKLTAKIEQVEMSTIRATLKEYNIKPCDLPELLKRLSKGDTGAVDEYAET